MQSREPDDEPKPAAGSTEAESKGLDAKRTISSPAEGEVFSLDIPFYRTRGAFSLPPYRQRKAIRVGHPATSAPFPLLLKFLVFMNMGEICAQNLEPVEVTGKILLTKELDGILERRMGVREGRWMENRLKVQRATGQNRLIRSRMRLVSGCRHRRQQLSPHPSDEESRRREKETARTWVTVECDKSQVRASPLPKVAQKKGRTCGAPG